MEGREILESVNVKGVPRRGEVVWQNLEGEMVLLNPQTGEYFGLNEVAGSFWEKVDGKRSLEQIMGELLEEYDVEKEELQKDIADLIGRMKPFNLILFD